MEKLKNKVAVVTSSTKGIGLACAELFAEEGAVTYFAARNQELADGIIKKITEKGQKAKFVYFNANEEETFTSMIEKVIQAEGRIDILVNNFGSTDVNMDKDLLNGDTSAFFDIIQKNLKSVYLPSKAAVASMIQTGGGSIVNISSIGSIIPDLSRTAYCVSKAAINSLSQNIALQYARQNIRCNVVLPGLTATKAAMDNMPQEFLDSFLAHVPLGRMGKPEDIAKSVLYYASDDSSYVTGMIHQVAGGYHLGTPQYAEFNSKKE